MQALFRSAGQDYFDLCLSHSLGMPGVVALPVLLSTLPCTPFTFAVIHFARLEYKKAVVHCDRIAQ